MAYRETMAAATERDEFPYAPARLTPRPTPAGYLFELQLPEQEPDGDVARASRQE